MRLPALPSEPSCPPECSFVGLQAIPGSCAGHLVQAFTGMGQRVTFSLGNLAALATWQLLRAGSVNNSRALCRLPFEDKRRVRAGSR